MPRQVRDEDEGGPGMRLMVTESEPKLGVGTGQDERVRLHSFGAGVCVGESR